MREGEDAGEGREAKGRWEGEERAEKGEAKGVERFCELKVGNEIPSNDENEFDPAEGRKEAETEDLFSLIVASSFLLVV